MWKTNDRHARRSAGRGGGSDMSGCVPGQLAPERRPTRFRNEHPVARQGQEASGNQSSQGPANENKRTRSAGDGHGHSSGDDEAVGTGCVLESAHFDLWEAAEGCVRGGMRTVFRYLNRLYLGLTKPRNEYVQYTRTDLINESANSRSGNSATPMYPGYSMYPNKKLFLARRACDTKV